jgi:hypothetical protein
MHGSCYCDAYQGFTSSSTELSFCVSFYTLEAAPSDANMLVSVVSDKNAIDLTGNDFATLASQDSIAVLPPTYLVRVQGSLDVRTEGIYKFCIAASEPATVSLDHCHVMLGAKNFMLIYAWSD